jgi:septal ring factor EnvC (AmiA/AmiB activator)
VRRLACLALALGLTGALVADDAVPTQAEARQGVSSARRSVKQLDRQRKQANRKELQDAKAEKAAYAKFVEQQRHLEIARHDTRVQVQNLGVVEDKLSRTEAGLAELGAQEQAGREALRLQLRAVQRSRSRQGAALLFSARTPAQWAQRASALQELSLGTHRRVLSLRGELEKLESYRVEYARQQHDRERELSATQLARRREQQEQASTKAAWEAAHHAKARDHATAAALEAEFEKANQGLQDELVKEEAVSQARAQARRRTGGTKVAQTTHGPSTLHGRAPWPVSGKLLSRFGKQRHPIFNVNVFNRGIEIASPYGTQIKAIAAGTVEHVGEMQGFGTLVVLDHGGGLKSVYGYASQALVQLDQAVAQGEAIAEVGQHGASGQPALYFQISKNAHPQDPLLYLSRR